MSYEEEDTCHMRRRLNVRRLLFIPSTHHIWDTATRNLKVRALLGTVTCILLLMVAFSKPHKSVPWYCVI
jgi:hypothetical protein